MEESKEAEATSALDVDEEKLIDTKSNSPTKDAVEDLNLPMKDESESALSGPANQEKLPQEDSGEDSNMKMDIDSAPDKELNEKEPDSAKGRSISPSSDKYESAEEEVQSGNKTAEPDQEKVEIEGPDVSEKQTEEMESVVTKAAATLEEGTDDENRQESSMHVDETSNSSAHLHDIEMTNVDESQLKSEDNAEGGYNRSIDPSTAEDPFDQVKQSTNDEHDQSESETQDAHAQEENTSSVEQDQENTQESIPDREEADNIPETDKSSSPSTNTEKDGEEAAEREEAVEREEAAEREEAMEGKEATEGEKAIEGSKEEQGEKESREIEIEESKEEEKAMEGVLEGNEAEAAEEGDAEQPMPTTEAGEPATEQEKQVSPTQELPTQTDEQPTEEESNATVDDLAGGENENVCLLPDDERAISEEDKERAIAEEEAEKEAERQETEARENEERNRDDATTADAVEKADGGQCSAAEKEGPVCEADSGANEAVTGNAEPNETLDEDMVTEETEADVTTSGGPSEDAPARENQIRELPTPVGSQTCVQCKRQSIPCVYSVSQEEVVASGGGDTQFICSFDCVQSIRTEFPGKFELIQQRVTIVPISGCTEKCVRCGEQTVCRFRYRVEENKYEYVCSMKCVEHYTAINSEKYSLKKRRYVIEEKTLPLGEDNKCVQCGDLKPCAFGFMQDEESLHVCSDCLNLFMTEHPDLFRLNRRRTVRVRDLPKVFAGATAASNASETNNSGDIVKFTARTDEEVEAARLDREASFQRMCFLCRKSLQYNSEECLQWETMDFCGTKCLQDHQNRIGEFCIYCKQVVPVPSLGKYCVRFGFSVCQFCSSACLDSYKKKLISCSYCQEDVSDAKRYVARVGSPGVFKDFCSQTCHKKYQCAVVPASKHRRHVCAVCNNEKMSKIIVHLDGREHFFCSTPCFSAFKFVNNVNPDECGMCRSYFERKSAEAYTIFPQKSGTADGSAHESIPFCTRMCLNLYINMNREIVACQWCKVKKYNFDMIQRAAGKVVLCSLHCKALADASVAAKTMRQLRCDHCMTVRTPQYHLTMSDASLRNFCTYQCVMAFQSQFNKPPLLVQNTEQEKSPMDMPVPTGLPKRIRKMPNMQITTASVPPPSTEVATKSVTPPVNNKLSSLPSNNSSTFPKINPPSTRSRERSGRSPAAPLSSPGIKNSSATESSLPVISSVKSLAVVPGSGSGRGTRAKGAANTLNQGKWPELRVNLEPLMNIPPSGTISLSSILPPPASGSSSSVTESSSTVTASAPAPPATPAPAAPPKIETHTQIVTIPPTPVPVANASTMCKPLQVTRSVSCRPIQCNVECQTDGWLQRKIVIPIPVPIYVPVPMFMYSMPTPVPVPIPLPIPVPVFIPTTRNSAAGIMKEIKKIQDKMPSDPYEAELLMMAEMVAGEKKKEESDSDSDDAVADEHFGGGSSGGGHEIEHNTSFNEDLVQIALKMASNEYEETQVDLESAMQANTISQQQQEHHGYTDLQQHHHQHQQLMMLEQQRQQDTTPTLVPRGRKRGPPAAGQQRSSVANNNTQPLTPSASKRIKREQLSEPSPEPVRVVEPVEKPDANMCLKYTFGVNAWKQWVLTKNAEIEKSTIWRKPFKSDILQLTADELNFSLCLFVKEVRKPNGTEYAPDTIYYLVLGIQQYLFENRRVENIFTDPYYERFTDCLDEVAKKFSVLYNDSQFIVTRVEEEHLWECKQLGAHSPHVLLSTLMFFNTKHFNLVSVEEHMELSFSHIMKHWKRTQHQGTKSAGSRNVLLRFYPPQSSLAANSRKKKVYEQLENEENPLRCPVKLYEFYLSKCPESVKTRNDVFYLQPERSCVPDSPVWYSTQPLSKESLSKMLHRVKMVKEINIALLTS